MCDQPIVSILVLSMNHEAYIEQCISSILQQSYRNIEILYLDNASSDQTASIAMRCLGESNVAFKVFKNSESKGISQNLNFLLSKANGEFVSPISGDDWFGEENIEKKVDFLQKHKTVAAAFSNGWEYYQNTGLLKLKSTKTFARGNVYRVILQCPDSVFYVGILYRRKRLLEVNGWDEALLIEDLDMLIRISQRWPIDFIRQPLVYYRRSISSTSRNIEFMLQGKRQYFEKYKNADWINMRWWLSDQYRRVGTQLINENRTRQSWKFLFFSLYIYCFNKDTYRSLYYLLRKKIAING